VWGVSDAGAARVRGVEAGGHRAGVRAVAIAPDDCTLLSLAGNAAKVRWLHHTISNGLLIWCGALLRFCALCETQHLSRTHAYTTGQAWNDKCGRACSQ